MYNFFHVARLMKTPDKTSKPDAFENKYSLEQLQICLQVRGSSYTSCQHCIASRLLQFVMHESRTVL
jgi:hypothetical protein